VAEAPLAIRTVILCDDVRREDNGKFLLIGVYSKDIGFASLPANFTITFWMEVDYLATGTFGLRFRALHRPSGRELFNLEGQAEIPTAERGNSLILGKIPVLVPGEGEIELQMSIDEGEWTLLKSLPVTDASQSARAAEVGGADPG